MIKKSVLSAVLAVGIAVTVAPAANAFTPAESAYLGEVKMFAGPLPTGANDAALVRVGHQVCADMRGGATAWEAASKFQGGTRFLVTMVSSASARLCPDQKGKTVTEARLSYSLWQAAGGR